MTTARQPEPATPSSLNPVLAVLGIGVVAAVIVAWWLNARLAHGRGPWVALWAYAVFATIFVWLDRRSSRRLAAGPPLDEVTMRHFVADAAAQAALATPLAGVALLLLLGHLDSPLSGLLALALAAAVGVMFVVGLAGCARARRRVMVSRLRQ